ncbi:WD repeat and HMG-box DNA-binding protein 1, partial [Protobothrops mucrosquamatus]|uniref:WD repeat and HMG-box DNA-binding protein 1 n=1 Tax=Protobothrops mucrosquamatus TaxID=103944 RepID=UPI000775EFF6
CTLEREFRCMELAELMTQNATSLAIKYASRSRRLILAQKLSEFAAEKVSEPASTEEYAEQEEEEEEKQQPPDFRNHLNAGYSNSPTEWSRARERNIQRQQNMETCEEDESKVNTANEAKSSSPTLHGHASISKSAVLASSNSIRANPFKVSSSQKDAFIHSPNILDNLIRLPKKNPTMNGQGAPNKKSPIIKPLMPKPKSKQSAATAFFQPRALTTEKKVREEREDKNDTVAPELQSVTDNKDNKRPKTGFQIWLEENRSSILSDNPHFEETEIIKEGMVRYRILSAEERMVWTEKAKGRETSDPSEGKKRKRPEDVNNKKQESQEQNSEEDVGSAKKSKSFNQSTFAKLSTFAYKQK